MKEFECKDWTKDLLVCITRLYRAEEGIKRWIAHGGGNMEIFTLLNLKGNSSIDLPEHPYLRWTPEEQKCFDTAFGKPLEVPKNLQISVSIADFLKILKKRRDFMRECLSMTPNSQFRNYRQKDEKHARKSAGREGQVHTGRKSSKSSGNYSKGTARNGRIPKRRGGSYSSGQKNPSKQRKNHKRN